MYLLLPEFWFYVHFFWSNYRMDMHVCLIDEQKFSGYIYVNFKDIFLSLFVLSIGSWRHVRTTLDNTKEAYVVEGLPVRINISQGNVTIWGLVPHHGISFLAYNCNIDILLVSLQGYPICYFVSHEAEDDGVFCATAVALHSCSVITTCIGHHESLNSSTNI